MKDEVVYFMRSAWIQSSKYVSTFWLGDQLVSWDSNDGLRSVVLGALSGGLCGQAFTHSDIGGYTVEANLGPNLNYIRSQELLERWSEFAAFGSIMYRTHIGSSTTDEDAQIYDSDESLAHFGEFADIFGFLQEYRNNLVDEAIENGLPLMRYFLMYLFYCYPSITSCCSRPLFLSYGYDDRVWELDEQYLFGEDFLVAPCMYEGSTTVNVYFPAYSGEWKHLVRVASINLWYL